MNLNTLGSKLLWGSILKMTCLCPYKKLEHLWRHGEIGIYHLMVGQLCLILLLYHRIWMLLHTLWYPRWYYKKFRGLVEVSYGRKTTNIKEFNLHIGERFVNQKRMKGWGYMLLKSGLDLSDLEFHGIFLTNPQILFCPCILNKYGYYTWQQGWKWGDAVVCKIIYNGYVSLRWFLRWKVRKGNSIDVLNHYWIWDRALKGLPKIVNVELIEGIKVVELIREDKMWEI